MPSVVTSISGIHVAGNGAPSGDGMLLLPPLVNVDSYSRLSISALSYESACSLPFSLRGATSPESRRSDLMKLVFLLWIPFFDDVLDIFPV